MNYIATYAKSDELGNASVIYEIVADDEVRAMQQARWQLDARHPDDAALAFVSLVAVLREPVSGVPS